MRISDWSSDVCSSDLQAAVGDGGADDRGDHGVGPASSVPASSAYFGTSCMSMNGDLPGLSKCLSGRIGSYQYRTSRSPFGSASAAPSMSGMASAVCPSGAPARTEEHTSELQSLMR